MKTAAHAASHGRLVAALFSIVAATVLLAACGGGASGGSDSAAHAPAGGLLQYSAIAAAPAGPDGAVAPGALAPLRATPPFVTSELATFGPANAPLALEAACPQITQWSNQDTDFFAESPPLRVIRVEHDNTPLPRGYYLPSAETRDVLATSFSMTASTTFTRDLRLANNLRAQMLSYSNEAKALEMFGRERAGLVKLNKGWQVASDEANSFLILYAEGDPARITDYPGEIQGIFLLRNTVAFLTVRSASADEPMSSVGVAKLAGRLVQARALVDGKCGGSVTNRAPAIELLPGQDGRLFQQVMVSRTTVSPRAHPGISIKVTDPDGRSDIDWSTFRVAIAGVDQTGNAFEVINRLVQEKRVQVLAGDTSEEYFLHLDPARLMGSHNLFNISFNGNWPIRLRICDKRGACSQQDVSRYFGPFFDVRDLVDLRCIYMDQFDLKMSAVWGNNGYRAMTDFYLALAQSSVPLASPRWYLTLGRVAPTGEFFWFEDWPAPHSLLPTSMPLAPGESNQSTGFKVSTRTVRQADPSGNHALPTGINYKVLYGALDVDVGAYHIDAMAQAVPICP